MRRHKKDNPVELSNMDGKFQTDRASRFFRKGYNCAQSVFAAHAEKLGLDLDTALKISAPLGGGVGRMREICGAFSACAMLAGLKFASAEASKEEKARIYEITQKLAEKFKAQNGSIICRELLGLMESEKSAPVPDERTAHYYASRPCEKIVENASKLASKEIFGE